jgi:hypothetical protein
MLLRNITLYHDSVDGTCDHVIYQRVVMQQHYGHVRCAVSIWPSHQRDDTVTAWAGPDVQRDTSPPSTPLAFFTFTMLLAPVINWEPHGVTLAGYCYARRHGIKVHIVILYRVSHNVTVLWYAVMLQVCTHLKSSNIYSKIIYWLLSQYLFIFFLDPDCSFLGLLFPLIFHLIQIFSHISQFYDLSTVGYFFNP